MPYIVAVAGASGSGKSTFAEELKKYLGLHGGCRNSDKCPNSNGCTNKTARVCIVPADRYFKNPLPTMVSPADGETYPDWNSPESVDMDALYAEITRIRDSGEAEYVIVEGVTILCDEKIRAAADVRVFIDASIEMRIYRRIKRNVETKKQSIEFIGSYYLKCARYREKEYALPSAGYADMHVDNEWGFDIEKEGEKILELMPCF